jgi:micrococcal nuclease
LDRKTGLFWAVVGLLLAASLHFGSNAEARRRAVQKTSGTLSTGDVVRLERVIDGDSLLVAAPDGERVAIRILGIKTFAPKPDEDIAARFGKTAIESIQQSASHEPIRVMLHSTPQDRHGRAIATLFVGDQDLGLSLVKPGPGLHDPSVPFAAALRSASALVDAKNKELHGMSSFRLVRHLVVFNIPGLSKIERVLDELARDPSFGKTIGAQRLTSLG